MEMVKNNIKRGLIHILNKNIETEREATPSNLNCEEPTSSSVNEASTTTLAKTKKLKSSIWKLHNTRVAQEKS